MKPRDMALSAVLLAAVLLSVAWPHIPMPQSLLDQVPVVAPGLSTRDLPLTESETRWLGGARGLKRLVQTGSGVWLLAVTDGSANRQAVHDPAYCFRGEGWQVSNIHTLPLPKGKATLYSLSQPGKSLEALAWFSDGGPPFDSTLAYWTKTTLRRLTRGLSGNEPLLFILRPLGPNPPNWQQAAPELISTLTPQAEL